MNSPENSVQTELSPEAQRELGASLCGGFLLGQRCQRLPGRVGQREMSVPDVTVRKGPDGKPITEGKFGV